MGREILKKETKIKRLIQSMGYIEEVQKALDILLDNSSSGSIHIDNLKPIDKEKIDACTPYLIAEKLIIYNREQRIIYISLWNKINYYNFYIRIKRRYIKSKINSLLDNDFLCGHIFAGTGDSDENIYTSFARGFKVPEEFKTYLTGEPMTEKEISEYMQTFPERIELEQKKRELTKEQKITLCLFMQFCENGQIIDFNVNRFLNSIKTIYTDRTYSYATIDLCIKKLIELQMVRIYKDKNGINVLEIIGYHEALTMRKNRYVIIPDVVFTKVFKKLQNSGIKVFFWLLFMLNNGEGDKGKYSGQKKAIYIKINKLSFDSIDTRKSFDKRLLWLKKRYPGEFLALIFGTEESETAALAEFFHFTNPDPEAFDEERRVQVRVRKEYFISKKADLFKPLVELRKKDKDKFDCILNVIKTIKPDYLAKDIVTVVKMLKNESVQFIQTLLDKLVAYAKKEEVYNPIGLLRKMYKDLVSTYT